MASRDYLLSRIAILFCTSGSIVLSRLTLFLEFCGCKSDHRLRSHARILMRIGFPRDIEVSFEMVQARGLGKICSQSFACLKVVEKYENFRKFHEN